jgi:serine acetyltransferase
MLLRDPSRLWFLSTRLYKKGWTRCARAIKAYNYFVFRAILPPEAELLEPVRLGHFGLNIVIHPNVSIGRRVHLWHSVTISASDSPGSATRVIIGDDVSIGAGAAIISRERQSLRICSSVVLGANCVVTRDLIAPGSYGGVPAMKLHSQRQDPKQTNNRESRKTPLL